MFGFDKIEKFLSIFVKDPVNVQSDQCVKELSRTSVCQYCIPACHADAINLSDGLDLDITKCDGCGFCVQACPNGVFDVNTPSDFELLAQVKLMSKDSKELMFTCKVFLEGKLRPNEISIPCVGRLHEGFLLASAIYGFKEIAVDAYHCGECDKYRPELLGRVIETSNSLASQLELGCAFKISDEDIKRSKNSDKEQSPDHGIHLSRRNFLEHLKQRTVDSTSELIVSSIPDFEDEDNSLTKKIPTNRSLLKQVMKRLKAEDVKIEAPDLFSNVTIADTCSACDFCSDLCPTEALKKTSRDNAVTLMFMPYLCTGCGLCIDVCPHTSITVEPANQPLNVNESYALVEATMVKCAKCGVQFASRDKSDKCIFCKKKEQLFA